MFKSPWLLSSFASKFQCSFLFFFKKKKKFPHFLSIYLLHSEVLVTTQHNLKGKKQTKTTFFQHYVCTVGPRELLGLEKQLVRLLLGRGNSLPRIYLEMVWQVRALLQVHSNPAPLEIFSGTSMHRHTKVLAHVPQPGATHVSKCSTFSGQAAKLEHVKMACFYTYRCLWWWYLN